MLLDDFEVGWDRVFHPTLSFKPKYLYEELTAHDLFDMNAQCVKMCLRIVKLVQDEHLWLKSIYIYFFFFCKMANCFAR